MSTNKISGYIGVNHKRFDIACRNIQEAQYKVTEAKIALGRVFEGNDPERTAGPTFAALDSATDSLGLLLDAALDSATDSLGLLLDAITLARYWH